VISPVTSALYLIACIYWTLRDSFVWLCSCRLFPQWRRQLCGTGARAPCTSNNFTFSSLLSKSDSQLSKCCVVCEISWCICQQLTALAISTTLVTKLLIIEQLLHPALKSTMSSPWRNFQLCPYSQQILATPLSSLSLYQPLDRKNSTSGKLTSPHCLLFTITNSQIPLGRVTK